MSRPTKPSHFAVAYISALFVFGAIIFGGPGTTAAQVSETDTVEYVHYMGRWSGTAGSGNVTVHVYSKPKDHIDLHIFGLSYDRVGGLFQMMGDAAGSIDPMTHTFTATFVPEGGYGDMGELTVTGTLLDAEMTGTFLGRACCDGKGVPFSGTLHACRFLDCS